MRRPVARGRDSVQEAPIASEVLSTLRVRSVGRAELSVRPRPGPARPVTGIARLRTQGCLKLLFPKGNDPLVGVLLNTSGGITGGDRLSTAIEVASGGALSLTTQAAERIYRAADGRARVETRLSVAPGAKLDWLPQETILFDRAALDRRLEAEVSGDAHLLVGEALVFGRRLSGERLDRIDLRDRIAIRRDGAPLLTDVFRLDAAGPMAGPGTLAGAGAMATLVLAAPDACARLDAVRAELGPDGGASAPRDGVLAVRLLAPDGFELRARLARLLPLLAGSALPPNWRI